MSAFPPPGQRPATKLPGERSAAVEAGREIFERAWVFAVSIDSPDEVTLDDAGRKVASLVRELMQAQMESYCAAVCPNCAGLGTEAGDVWINMAAAYAPEFLTHMFTWTHECGRAGAAKGYLPCYAGKVREAWRKGIWADGIE